MELFQSSSETLGVVVVGVRFSMINEGLWLYMAHLTRLCEGRGGEGRGGEGREGGITYGC